ncbi:glycosyltransferase family 10 domain-containing protein [Ruegeria lacuscaerulensis]|uniref:glycosyltransferase family 10 domain-containing protein n=1 Tax=Ruegeria lacuscaerulensis TaxID=55218 RepID=UPI001480396F|nr:glycosyltransferase family 10 [Ruegeria lacuscaerulensis]
METMLPRHRTAIIAAEPEVIFGYKKKYLEQFGIVVTTNQKDLDAKTWRTATCWYWYAGINFDHPADKALLRGYDFFDSLEPPEKSDKISIVTSDKTLTEFQRRRLRFIDEITRRIPDHLEIFGRGIRQVPDKADALLPYKYHIALENCEGLDTWTEKFADPVLCWTFPFYAGCDNLAEYFPRNSFLQIDLDNPEAAVNDMMECLNSDRWGKMIKDIGQAREKILKQYNLAFLLDRLAAEMLKTTEEVTQPQPRYIWSERTFYPEKGTRGNVAEWLARNAVLMLDKQAEAKIKQALSRRREKKGV